jgi:flagellar hook assembly protein FlgD
MTAISGAIALHGNLPNPFRQSTTIRYALPKAMPVQLTVYDVTGRTVRTLLNGVQLAGEGAVTWDGRNESGTQVGDGVYLYRLEAGGTDLTRKMIIVR